MKYLEQHELKIGETYLCKTYDDEYLILKYSTDWPRGWIRYVIMEIQGVVALINEVEEIRKDNLRLRELLDSHYKTF